MNAQVDATLRLLVAAARTPPGPDQALELRRLAPLVDWQDVVARARRAGLVGVVHHALSEGAVSIPKSVAHEMIGHRLAAEYANRTALELTAELVAQARSENLVLVPIKGAALLLEEVYPLDLRPMCDVDLVAGRQEHEQIEALLVRNGFEAEESREHSLRHHHHVAYVHRDRSGPMVELHWTFFYRMFGSPQADAAVSRRLRRVAWGEATLEAPDPEDQVLSILAHLATHRFRGQLKWLADVGWAAARWQIDWSIVLERAASIGARRAVMHGLKLFVEVFGVPPRGVAGVEGSLALSLIRRLNPPAALLVGPEHPPTWRRPLIDLFLHDRPTEGLRRILAKAAKQYEERYGRRAPQRAVLDDRGRS